ncbi:hypothetical protein [Novosphingobium aquimarinum]|uniref:hypothetical protein n=1 Tax=Novosphingobium aquimarinum TaxID=2682494 RepID=UPI0012EB2DC7|nr:hypothetical protein [Novosphingobium aquimarinum]
MPDLPQMLAPAHYVTIQGLAFPSDNDETVIVGPGSPLPVRAALADLAPAAWNSLSSVQDLTGFASAEVQVSGLSGGDRLAFLRSLDEESFVPVTSVYDMNGNGPFASVSSDGIYLLPGGGWLKLERSGTASTPSLTVRAGQR